MQIWYILVTLFQIWFLQIISCNSDKGKSYDFIWAFQSQTNCMIIWSLSVIILYYIDIGINYECFLSDFYALQWKSFWVLSPADWVLDGPSLTSSHRMNAAFRGKLLTFQHFPRVEIFHNSNIFGLEKYLIFVFYNLKHLNLPHVSRWMHILWKFLHFKCSISKGKGQKQSKQIMVANLDFKFREGGQVFFDWHNTLLSQYLFSINPPDQYWTPFISPEDCFQPLYHNF